MVLFLWLMNSMQGGGGRGVMQFAKSKAKLISKDMPKTTFADVAGCDEAIEELGEIKEFLQEPAKFQAVGAKIPKGVLLYGAPGTGKTLLARAVAGEAGVPFYSISGSDFVEMFVGVGASRVRDLFEQAKENAPAIVFIDEIDAVGRHRGTGMGGGHDEREQTLNQLLVEMDGFDVRGGVILIAATNRPDVLDPALLRPGRFDRQIQVDAPDLAGREQILQVHSRGKPLAAGRRPDLGVARRTPGFSGADLANVLNEAALLTARNNQKLITNETLDEAIDRVIAGPQRRTRLMSEKEKLITAYHEGGHALVAAALPGQRPRAQGDDPAARPGAGLHDGAARLRQVLPAALADARPARLHARRPGGRGDGLPRPDHRRRQRHREGHRRGPRDGHPVRHDRAAGRDQARRRPTPSRSWAATSATQRNYSEEVAGIVDEETKKLLATAHQEAFDILEENRDVLDALVLELLDKETLDKEQIAAVFEPLRRRPERPAWTGSPDRRPSDDPGRRDPRGDPRPRGRQRLLRQRRQRQHARRAVSASWSPRPAPAATCTATRASVPGVHRRRRRRPAPPGPT